MPASPAQKSSAASVTDIASTSLMSRPPRWCSSTDAWNRLPSHSSQVVATPAVIAGGVAPQRVQSRAAELEPQGETAVALLSGLAMGYADTMWFDTWGDLGRLFVVGPLAYIVLVAVLRISGARTLSKLNAFDLVVTVALGSTLATVLLDTSVSFAEGVLALALLVLLQFVVGRSSVRWRLVERLVKSDPVLVYCDRFLDAPMRRVRVTEDEVRQAVRGTGRASLDEVAAVVLETDGTLSVLSSVPDLRDQDQ